MSGILLATMVTTNTHIPVVEGLFHITHDSSYATPFVFAAYFGYSIPKNENKSRMVRLQDAQAFRRSYTKQATA